MKTILSIRFQFNPLWIIKDYGTVTHWKRGVEKLPLKTSKINPDLSQYENEEEGLMDFQSWIKDNKDKYQITHVLDENWIEFDLPYDINNPMEVDQYINDTGYST